MGRRLLIKARPGTFSLISLLYLPSEKVVHPTCPPMEVTEVLPTRTLLDALTFAFEPIAVAFVKPPLVTSAPYPMAVLFKPFVLFFKADEPKAELFPPVELFSKADEPLAVFNIPEVLLVNALTPKAELAE